jgi:hypothetical protein
MNKLEENLRDIKLVYNKAEKWMKIAERYMDSNCHNCNEDDVILDYFTKFSLSKDKDKE